MYGSSCVALGRSWRTDLDDMHSRILRACLRRVRIPACGRWRVQMRVACTDMGAGLADWLMRTVQKVDKLRTYPSLGIVHRQLRSRPCTSSARPRRGAGRLRRGRCCFGGTEARVRSPARRCQRRGRARRAGHDGRSWCPRGRPVPGRYIPTVGQNHRSPGGLPAGARCFVVRVPGDEGRKGLASYFRASKSSWQAWSQRRQASAQTWQCGMWACRSHSSPQLRQIATQDSSSGRVRLASYCV
jgi:hypothetical protein